jgi:hypothetical protein
LADTSAKRAYCNRQTCSDGECSFHSISPLSCVNAYPIEQ